MGQAIEVRKVTKPVETVAALATLVVIVGCAGEPPAHQARAQPTPGTIVEIHRINDVDPSIRKLGGASLSVKYRSTLADGRSRIVGGSLFLPPAPPPRGGWTILGLGHGSTGILKGCGPSSSPDLLGMAPNVASWVEAGFAVAVTDYVGLNGPGVHVYLDNQTEGRNIIDAVRAMRRTRPADFSKRWIALGGSQGGGATWSASEQASSYAPELDLVAAVSTVPAADVSGFARVAEDESLTRNQSGIYTWLLISQGRAHPDLDMNLYRRGSVKRNWKALAQCYGSWATEENRALQEITPSELKPATHAATLKLQQLLKQMAVPKRRADAPMLVIYGGQDEFINPAWTRSAIKKACGMGTRIQVDFQPDRTHGTFDGSQAYAWLKDRLAGRPFVDSCPHSATPNRPTGAAKSTNAVAPTSTEAEEQLQRLKVADRVKPSSAYRRGEFGSGWSDTDHNGCNQRDDVLVRDAVPGTVKTARQGRCDHDVLAGTWIDPYTGRTIVVSDAKQPSQSMAIQIDHIVPLSEAWVSGASEWSRDHRRLFSNDLSNLLAVDGPTNESKGDHDPAAWRPRKAYQCRYARRWIATKLRWNLTADPSEIRALQEMLGYC